MSSLAYILDNQEKPIEAKGVYRQTLKLQETVLRKEHPDTLLNMHNLARTLTKPEDWGGGEKKKKT